MPKLGPIRRRELLHYLRRLGFTGPYSGGRHQFMVKDDLRVRIPNPHGSDIGPHLLNQILREAGIDKSVWEAL
jgi:predicted RNA binding protein YcfA (HicA-like mRNA interferase family)